MEERTSARRAYLEALVVVFVPIVVLAALALAVSGVSAGVTFFGATPTQEMLERRTVLVAGAFIVGTGGPLAGMAVAAYTGQRVVAVIYGVILATTLVIAAVFLVGRAATEDPPAEPRGPRVCQEHSGGDTRCPGG